jgi:3-oxoadipate enol-lactonase
MTTVDVRGARFNCRIDGPPEAPLLVLSNSLGTNLAMWDDQMAALAQRFRVLRYDARGHGASSVTPGPYTIEELARDALALLDALKARKAHFCGLSMGGMAGMWLAVHAAERIDRLVLADTAPQIGTQERWNTRIENVRKRGLAAIADGVLEGWFTKGFRERAPASVARFRAMLTATPAEGYIASCAAVRDANQWDTVGHIASPTLVITGTHDASTPPAEGRKLAERVSGARYVELDAAHISNVEAAERFTAELTGFLNGVANG